METRLILFALLAAGLILFGCATQNLPSNRDIVPFPTIGIGNALRVQPGDWVQVDYVAVADGFIFETSFPDVARSVGLNATVSLGFIVGQHKVIFGLEKAVVGMVIGQNRTVEFSAQDAFGLPKKELYRNVSRSDFGNQSVQAGMVLAVDEHTVGRVFAVDESNVTFDLNHPLAGKTVQYYVVIGDIRRIAPTAVPERPSPTADPKNNGKNNASVSNRPAI